MVPDFERPEAGDSPGRSKYADLVSKTSEWGHKRGHGSQGTSIVNRSRGGWIERVAWAVHNWPSEAQSQKYILNGDAACCGAVQINCPVFWCEGFEGARLQRSIAMPLEIAKTRLLAAEGLLIAGEKNPQGLKPIV